jgi:hypothetical protein
MPAPSTLPIAVRLSPVTAAMVVIVIAPVVVAAVVPVIAIVSVVTVVAVVTVAVVPAIVAVAVPVIPVAAIPVVVAVAAVTGRVVVAGVGVERTRSGDDSRGLVTLGQQERRGGRAEPKCRIPSPLFAGACRNRRRRDGHAHRQGQRSGCQAMHMFHFRRSFQAVFARCEECCIAHETTTEWLRDISIAARKDALKSPPVPRTHRNPSGRFIGRLILRAAFGDQVHPARLAEHSDSLSRHVMLDLVGGLVHVTEQSAKPLIYGTLVRSADPVTVSS